MTTEQLEPLNPRAPDSLAAYSEVTTRARLLAQHVIALELRVSELEKSVADAIGREKVSCG